ncbi:hypothetical protein [Jejuia pallidilutea]|uniref:Uncharacterized protein n=2 Tax=Jejuia pallidilutea TaxID=504487 RepID=A0A090WJ90_9FLAO|nr:hypothetical protein [Jejuia pallidilutea]GAL67512.1 hypothetical protein JCM19301_485 [Jejuia pallidilutea]GAL71312.1 hypothetical protein JCM19302_989 [Jejuia pallidilutea]
MKVLLKILRRAFKTLNKDQFKEGRNWWLFSNKTYANQLIYDALQSNEPCMIARYGSTEMVNIINYIGVKQNNRSIKDFITGKSLKWWWDPSVMKQLQVWSGFFPPTQKHIETFCDLMLEDTQQVDILGSWLHEERHLAQGLSRAKRIMLEDLEPFFCSNPWTKALEGKKVLVVHPFVSTIEKQYKKRDLLFDNNLLPEFDLKTIKAVQSVAGTETEFKDWFEALEYMKQQIDATDYDICIIGCGAYGFPLAAHVKRSGKKAIHMAGATQLLFGIIGKRWEDYIVFPYMNLFNEHWVRPGENEKPKNANVVEGACYW